jgi:hypothetical protein
MLGSKVILLGDDTWAALSRDWLGWIVFGFFCVFRRVKNVYRRFSDLVRGFDGIVRIRCVAPGPEHLHRFCTVGNALD